MKITTEQIESGEIKLNRLREELGISPTEIARKTGMSRAGVYRALGDNRLPLNPLIRRVWCNLFGIEKES